MKTIIDAVNELQANLNNAVCSENSYGFLKYSGITRTWVRNPPSIANHSYEDVCSVREFIHTISSMTYNFGKITGADLYDYINTDKELLQPTKPEAIYTQEMCDNGELPSVGMECLYLDTNKEYIKCKVVYLSEWSIVLEQTEKGYAQGVEVAKAVDYVTIKPLTPPIKLIDGKAYQFEHNGIVWNGIYIKSENSMLYSLRTAEVVFCTNIQLLTVGDK